jgi:energy-coupling factor transporter transmembrane protein EcfT
MTRGSADLHLLRLVPGDSVIHRLWAGTKLLTLVAMTTTLSITPNWPAIALNAALVLGCLVAARIPPRAAPRPPLWLWAGLALTALLALLAGGSPTIHLGTAVIGLGGLAEWARATAIAVIILAAAMLTSWTTPFGDIPAALDRLGAPLRRIGLPVAEWSATAALALRCLPVLLDDIGIVLEARRLRADPHDRPRRLRARLASAFAAVQTVLVVATRRAREIGDAVEARGGWRPTASRGARVAPRDGVALAVVALVTTVSFIHLP